jgi:hypothetical protein
MVPAYHYQESVYVVSMGEDLGPVYEHFEREITQRLAQGEAQGKDLLPWFEALLVYPDMPWLGWTCQTMGGDLLGEAPALPRKVVYPLERALIGYVRTQFEQRLPIIVFTENTGQYDDQERLKDQFERFLVLRSGRAPHVAILRETVGVEDRQTWIDQRRAEGVDVLICNSVRIFDLNLTYFKRIAYKRIPLSTQTLYRSAHCLLRAEQDQNVETVFFAYQNSIALRFLRWLTSDFSMVNMSVFLSQETEQRTDVVAKIAQQMIQEMEQEKAN